jgi:hypothetical protein
MSVNGSMARAATNEPYRGRIAHFLLLPELANSPPNEALVGAYLDLGYDVDLYAPGPISEVSNPRIRAFPAEYGWRWLLRNAWRMKWHDYAAFSCTSEDPVAVTSVIARLAGKPFISLADEIKSGSYWGDRPRRWKQLCQWGLRSAQLNIVNDECRVTLLRDYAAMPYGPIQVYPGCFRQPPPAIDVAAHRAARNVPPDALVLGASGNISILLGMDWLIDAMNALPYCYASVQPVNINPFVRYLLQQSRVSDRILTEAQRLSWRDAWAQAPFCDIGLAIYRNPGPQFQQMGVSSNRLCMFLAMGVPVIATRQPSFQFLLDYDCGMLVDTSEEFTAAVENMRPRLAQMKQNALKCAREYIAADQRFEQLRANVASILG